MLTQTPTPGCLMRDCWPFNLIVWDCRNTRSKDDLARLGETFHKDVCRDWEREQRRNGLWGIYQPLIKNGLGCWFFSSTSFIIQLRPERELSNFCPTFNIRPCYWVYFIRKTRVPKTIPIWMIMFQLWGAVYTNQEGLDKDLLSSNVWRFGAYLAPLWLLDRGSANQRHIM